MTTIDDRNKVRITLDQKNPLYGGDTITGTVHLDVQIPFVARGFLVKFKGIERAQWEEKYKEKVEDKTYERIRIHKEANDLFRSVVNLHPQGGTLDAGHYEFPFKFTLPPKLPGTFIEQSSEGFGTGNAWQAMIFYKVKACPDVKAKHNLKTTMRLVVREPVIAKEGDGSEGAKSFLLGGGKLSVRAWTDKPAYPSGNTAQIRIETNNTSTWKTKRMQIRVVRTMTIAPLGEKLVRENKMYEQNYGGFDPLYFGIRYFPYSIPVTALPSTSTSKIVKHEYSLYLIFSLQPAVNLTVKLPLVVFAPAFMFTTPPEQPPVPQLPPDTNFRPNYQLDSEASICGICSQPFSLLNRKHHCRNCLRVFCKLCSAKRVAIPNLGFPTPVRVCDECFPLAQSGGKRLELQMNGSQQPLAGGVNYIPPPMDTSASAKNTNESQTSVATTSQSKYTPPSQAQPADSTASPSLTNPSELVAHLVPLGPQTGSTKFDPNAFDLTPDKEEPAENPFIQSTPSAADVQRQQRQRDMQRRIESEKSRQATKQQASKSKSTYVPGLLGDDPGDNPFL